MGTRFRLDPYPFMSPNQDQIKETRTGPRIRYEPRLWSTKRDHCCSFFLFHTGKGLPTSHTHASIPTCRPDTRVGFSMATLSRHHLYRLLPSPTVLPFLLKRPKSPILGEKNSFNYWENPYKLEKEVFESEIAPFSHYFILQFILRLL